MVHICVRESGPPWYNRCPIPCSTPYHYLNKCRPIINLTAKNPVMWNFSQCTIEKICIQNDVCRHLPFCRGLQPCIRHTICGGGLVSPVAVELKTDNLSAHPCYLRNLHDKHARDIQNASATPVEFSRKHFKKWWDHNLSQQTVGQFIL